MLILLSTSFVVAQHEKISFYSFFMKSHLSYSVTGDCVNQSKSWTYSQVQNQIVYRQTNVSPVMFSLRNVSQKLPSQDSKSCSKIPKSHYLQTLSVEDAQQEKRNRILRQKSSTETSGLGSSLDYTSTDDLNNRSSSNSRRHSSTSSALQETKVIYSHKSSPVPVTNRKVSWRTQPTVPVNSNPMIRGFSRSENFTLETIESSGSSHANNDHSTPQSLTETDPNARFSRQYSKLSNSQELYGLPMTANVRDFSYKYFQKTLCLDEEANANSKLRTYYDSDLDFGMLIYDDECVNGQCGESDGDCTYNEMQQKRIYYNSKTVSIDSERKNWCNWSKERRAESARRTGSDFCQAIKNSATKNSMNANLTELQSLIPKTQNRELDQYQNTNHNNNNTNASSSTSQANNPSLCNDTYEISPNYLTQMSQKKYNDRKRRDEENRLTHEQIHYLVEYWDHDTFVRLRSWAVCFALLAVVLQIFVGFSAKWSFYEDDKSLIYSGLWMTCITENSSCTPSIPFMTANNGYRDSILCLVAVSSIFSIGGSGLSFTGLCVTALARKLYYYHSAGEIFFVSGMTMALAVSLYSITIEFHFKFYRHKYGYTFWLAWVAAVLLLVSALNLLMDEVIQSSTKFRICSCLAKCFKCRCCHHTETVETSTRIYPPQDIRSNQSIRRTQSTRNHHSHKVSRNSPKREAPGTSTSHHRITECSTHWKMDDEITEDFV